MSLPSRAVFYNKGEEVSESFVNCGWFWHPDNMNLVKRTLMELKFPDGDWDELIMYEEKYTYREVINLVMNEV